MRLFRTALVCGTAAVCAEPACAEPAEPLLVMAPASNWVLDYAEQSCALRRAFVAGEESAILEMRQYGPGEQFEIAVVSETLSRTRRTPRVRFEPDAEWHTPHAALFIDAGSSDGVLYNDTLRSTEARPAERPLAPWSEEDRKARELMITGISVADSFERDLTLQTGKLHQSMEAMRACTQELTSHWGLDPVTPGPLARGPTPDGIREWSRRAMEAYPSDMLGAGKSGRVPVRLVVGKDGKPKSCQAVGLAEQSFIEAACGSLMRHARFNPALDGNGEPADGTFVTTVIYQTWP